MITSLQPSVPPASKLTRDVEDQLLLTVGVAPAQASPTELMQAVSHAARQLLSRRWVETQAVQRTDKARRVYYLSMEFLMGRTLSNALAALELQGDAAQAMQAHAHHLEDVADQEPDAAARWAAWST